MADKQFPFYDADDSMFPPPIPPRNKKFKTELKPSFAANLNKKNFGSKNQPFPLSLQPPIPPRFKLEKKKSIRFDNENCLSTIEIVKNNLEFNSNSSSTISKNNQFHNDDKVKKYNHKSKVISKQIPCNFKISENDKNLEKNKANEKLSKFLNTERILHNEREEKRIYFNVDTHSFDQNINNCNIFNNTDKELKIEEYNHLYIFEDYIDRNNRINAKSVLLMNDDLFSLTYTDDHVSTEKSTSRVRFSIESPSTCNSDFDLNYSNTVYKNFIEKQIINHDTTLNHLNLIMDKEIDKNIGKSNNNHQEGENNQLEPSIIKKNVYHNNSLKIDQMSDIYIHQNENVKVFIDKTYVENNYYNNEMTVAESNLLKNENNEIKLHKQDTLVSNEEELLVISEQNFNKSYIHIALHEVSDKRGINKKSQNTQTINNCIDFTNSGEQKNEIPSIHMQNKFNLENEFSDVLIARTSLFEKKPVPLNQFRYHFLETMLNDNNFSKNSQANCEIIAAYLKDDSNVLIDQNKNIEVLDVSAAKENRRVTSKPDFKIELMNRSKEKILNRMNTNSSNNKSIGEIKTDVLKELMTNFNDIKLRSVNTIDHKLVKIESSNEQNKLSSTFIGEKNNDIDKTIQEKNDIKKSEINNLKINVNSKLLDTEKNSTQMNYIKEGACAIVKEPVCVLCNANENSVRDPIVISNDQFSEVASITPGSVKNFIKYYEIYSKTNHESEIKNNTFENGITQNDKIKYTNKITNASNYNKQILDTTNTLNTVSTKYCSISPNVSKQSNIKNLIVDPISEMGKSVQFNSECTIKNFSTLKTNEDEEGTFSSCTSGIKKKMKRKAPLKPEFKISEKSERLEIDQPRTDSSAIIYIQKSSEAELMACTSESGNRSFLPKNKNLQNHQTLVFYYTV